MIYYDIQHHGALDGLNSLIPLLEHENNHIFLSYDCDLNQRTQKGQQLEKIQDTFSPNFQTFRYGFSPKVSWGGSSITNAMYTALKRALEVEGWRYFINLSGLCVPLKRQDQIINVLGEYEKKNIKSFCYAFEPKKPMLWFSKRQGLLKKETRYARVKFLADRNFCNALKCREFDPARNVMHRIAASYKEIDKNLYEVSGLDLEEISKRSNLFNEGNYLVGRQWVILSREQAEWLVNSEFVSALLETLQDVFISDEIFFQVALNSKNNPFRDKVAKSSLRFKEGMPCKLDKLLMQEALNSEAIFGRKVTSDVIEYLMKELKND